MLVRNLTSCLLLHIILDSCSVSARSCLLEIIRITCYLTWTTLRRRSYIKVGMLPVWQKLLGVCVPNDHGLCMQLNDNVVTFTTTNSLLVACTSPMLLTNGTSHITLQMNVQTVRLNRLNLPETIWVRILSYYMPKQIKIGALEWRVQLVKIAKRTMQFRLCGDVSKWTGKVPASAYVRFTHSTLELFAIPNLEKNRIDGPMR
jgi:hypothetical protein